MTLICTKTKPLNSNYIIECLSNGAPHGPIVSDVVSFFNSISDTTNFDIIRIQFVIHLFARMLKIRQQPFCIKDYWDLIEQELKTAQAQAASLANFVDMAQEVQPVLTSFSAAEATSNHYSTMFSHFSEEDFFVISPENLKTLFSINNVLLTPTKNQHALDAGCGSGRYAYALHLMGFKSVTGIDFSENNIAFAKNKISEKGLSGLNFQVADVSQLPFDTNSFDFVFSNGVLHHVDASYEKTLSELYRVMKPGGEGFLFVMETPGGILHDTIELCRYILKDVPEENTLTIMNVIGFSSYRIYAILDHIYAPINTRISPCKLEALLKQVGFIDLKRFERGLPSDDSERLYKDPNNLESVWKYGVGENRYIFKKPEGVP